MENIILYALTAFLALSSFFIDKGKTKQAFKKAWKAFEKILPQLLGVVAL
ncbi:MAG: permease, partial [Thermotogaceae bacterium]|nr:permease [Thermotogaceae bacterium]